MRRSWKMLPSSGSLLEQKLIKTCVVFYSFKKFAGFFVPAIYGLPLPSFGWVFLKRLIMRTVVLHRDIESDEGTLGRLFVGWKLFCHSIELPDRNNERNYSRIPAGKYRCVWHRSPRFGWVYLVTCVDGRSHILIHAANWAGDSRKGYRCNLNGCIALGSRRGKLAGQSAVLASRLALNKFFRVMNKKPFDLIIVESANA